MSGCARLLLGGSLMLFLSSCSDSSSPKRDASLDGPHDVVIMDRDGASPDQARGGDTTDSAASAGEDVRRDLAMTHEVGVTDTHLPSTPDARQPDTAMQPDLAVDHAIDRAAQADTGQAVPVDAVQADAGQAVPVDAAQADAGQADPVDAAQADAGQTDPVDADEADAQDEDGLSAPFCSGVGNLDGGGAQRLCYDFDDPASAADFVPEAGSWVVSGGVYKATGPEEQVTCPGGWGSMMTSSVLNGLSAKNVRVRAKMRSIDSPDKVLVLRSRSGGNRLEVNYRANYVSDEVVEGGDLYIDALVDCDNPTYLDIGQVFIPHAMGQTILAEVQLVGQQLTVAMDGRTVFDQTIPFSTEPGSVGFATFVEGEVEFDDLMIEVLP